MAGSRNRSAFPGYGIDYTEAIPWASRGSAAQAGATFRANDVGTGAGTVFIADGTYWRPVNGRVCLVQRSGLIASPLATVASAAALFSGIIATIPAGLIAPNSRVWVSAQTKRTGANTAGQFDCQIGTGGAGADSLLGRVQSSATDGHVAVLEAAAQFGSSTTSFIPRGSATPQGSTGGGTVIDRSTNINTASAMTVTIGMTSASALDSYALLHFSVYLEC